MSVKIEIGFTPSGASGPFFTLDDAVKGLLDSFTYILGGEVLSDVTEYVLSFQIGRGKSIELDRFTAGGATVSFNNETRVFDPTYEDSPFYGQIKPKRRLKISVDDIVQFDGTIDDWDIQYQLGGYSVAVAKAVDATQVLTNVTLNDFFPDEELTGARVDAVLDAISWSADKRDIDNGSTTVVGDLVADNTNSFQYLQQVAQSEPGDLFVSKDGRVKFTDRNAVVSSETVVFTDEGDGVPYVDIQALFGSELLFNNITVTSSAGTATASDATSVLEYGVIDYSIDTLIALEAELTTFADYLLEKYAEPQYRISSLTVNLKDLTTEQRADVLGIDLGDVVGTVFTPAGIPPAIVNYAKVIRIEQSLSPANETYTIGVEPLSGVTMILDNPVFGRLDAGYRLGVEYNAWTLNDTIYGRLSAGMAVS
tara:strand:- start:537 stop:1808 length:1272 start_codon:yes stop_codon:yes gene_type:complete